MQLSNQIMIEFTCKFEIDRFTSNFTSQNQIDAIVNPQNSPKFTCKLIDIIVKLKLIDWLVKRLNLSWFSNSKGTCKRIRKCVLLVNYQILCKVTCKLSKNWHANSLI